MSKDEPEVEIYDGEDFQNLLEAGHRALAIQDHQSREMAIRHPRDEEACVRTLMTRLEMAPHLAPKYFYRYTLTTKRGRDQGKKTVVQGPTIKAAMEAAQVWRNCADAMRYSHEDEDSFYMDGAFIDFETNRPTLRQVRCLKHFHYSDGSTRLLEGDRLMAATHAAGSRAVRNAIVNGLPEYFVDGFFRKAVEISGDTSFADPPAGSRRAPAKKTKAGNLSWAQRRRNALEFFAKKFQISEEMLVEYIGEDPSRWRQQEFANLSGLQQGLESGRVKKTDIWNDATDQESRFELEDMDGKIPDEVPE